MVDVVREQQEGDTLKDIRILQLSFFCVSSRVCLPYAHPSGVSWGNSPLLLASRRESEPVRQRCCGLGLHQDP